MHPLLSQDLLRSLGVTQSGLFQPTLSNQNSFLTNTLPSKEAQSTQTLTIGSKNALSASLESIATVAAAAAAAKMDQENDKMQEKVAKRRKQIALASRKSRAKRKREVEELRETNQVLSDEISRLRKRLRDLGDDTESESGDSDNKISRTSFPKQEDSVSDNSSVQTEAHGFVMADPKLSTEAAMMERLHEQCPEMKQVLQYLESRMSWYFKQLKDDAANFHGEKMSEESKMLLKSLDAQIFVPQKEGQEMCG